MDIRTHHTIAAESSNRLTPHALPQMQSLVEEFPDLAPGLVMSTLRSSGVWGGTVWRRAFAGCGDQSAPARRMVGQLLADTGRVDDARWVTAELVSNALRHSRSGRAQGFFVVEVLRGAQVARIVVYDLGGGQIPDFSRTPGSLPEAAEHGRGLAGVAELAVRVGVTGDTRTGHAVWADLALISDAARASRSAGEAGLSPDASMGEVAARGPEVVAARELEPHDISGLARQDTALVAQEETAGDLTTAMGSVRRSRLVGEERAVSLDPSAGQRGEALRPRADRVSTFGQEPWAQQALAGLRRDWPDWAFLVVRDRWLAMRGKQVVISATGPQELRQALPPTLRTPFPPKRSSDEPFSAGSGSAVPGPVECGVPELGPVLPALAELPATALDADQARSSVSSSPASAWTPGEAGAAGGEGADAGAGLSGTLTAVAPSPGVLAAQRSGTGTWAVAAADRSRTVWWPQGWSWWPWGKRRGRSRPEEGARPAGRDRPADGGPRHRQVRAKPTVVAAAVAA